MNIGNTSPNGRTFGWLYAAWTFGFALLFVLGIWLVMFFWLDDGATGIGVGVFCAFWGAPGFGLMAAGAQWWSGNEHEQIGAHGRTSATVASVTPVAARSETEASNTASHAPDLAVA